jgi:hypothetical protein
MKQNKKAKIYAAFGFAGKKKLLVYIYAVIVKQNFYKRSTNHYNYQHLNNLYTYQHRQHNQHCHHQNNKD